jgi:AraC family transcriptional regulator
VKSIERPSGIPPACHYPGAARRVLGELKTPAGKVEEVEYASGLCLARHSHDTPHLIYIVEGLHWSGHSRGGDACAPGTVRFIPSGEPHENYFPVRSRCLSVELLLPTLEFVREEGAFPNASGELVSPSAPVQGARLRHEFQQNDDLSALAVEGLLLELLLSGVRRTCARSGPAPGWLLQLREMIHDQGSRRLTLGHLAKCAGRHPVQVSRQFRHYFGCTISQYVRQVRIARAQMLLSRRDMSVAEIALASGFADQSHFTNTFRRLTGLPPHRYRMLNSKTPVRH